MNKFLLIGTALAGMLCAQQPPDQTNATLQAILSRLENLERQNQELKDEIHALREELSRSNSLSASASATSNVSQAPIEDRVEVSERRVEEQAQTKVEASQKFPITMTGTLLFNAFANGRASDYSTLPNNYDLLTGPSRAGATLRQTLIGLQFRGPSLPGEGSVHADLTMDLYGGDSAPLSDWLRIRRGVISLDWQNRSFVVGQDKPLISPRQPDSLAEVGTPPLAGIGNLWLWVPQARYEERRTLGKSDGLTAQLALVQTSETYSAAQPAYGYSPAKSRPGIEGRLAYWHKWDDTKRVEIASGFHESTTHVAGSSVPSRLVSTDWLLVPSRFVRISGTYFYGRNFSNLGALTQGFTVTNDYRIIAVHGHGGWLQLSLPLTGRVTINAFGGIQDSRKSDLLAGNLLHAYSYAANLMYHVSPNVVVSVEGLQIRTLQLPSTIQLRNHYDLAVAYLF